MNPILRMAGFTTAAHKLARKARNDGLAVADIEATFSAILADLTKEPKK